MPHSLEDCAHTDDAVHRRRRTDVRIAAATERAPLLVALGVEDWHDAQRCRKHVSPDTVSLFSATTKKNATSPVYTQRTGVRGASTGCPNVDVDNLY